MINWCTVPVGISGAHAEAVPPLPPPPPAAPPAPPPAAAVVPAEPPLPTVPAVLVVPPLFIGAGSSLLLPQPHKLDEKPIAETHIIQLRFAMRQPYAARAERARPNSLEMYTGSVIEGRPLTRTE
jgi:hypothetical protein